MPIRVQVGNRTVEFPDGTPEQEMAAALDALPPEEMQPVASHGPQQAPLSTADQLKADMQSQGGLSPQMSSSLIDGLMGGGVMTAAPAAAGQGVKMIQGLARRLYGGLLKPKQGLKDSFGDATEIAGGLLNERAPISRGGVEKMTKRLGDSRNTAMGMVKNAEAAGTQGVVAKDVIGEFKPVVGELRKRVDIGQADELAKVGKRGKAILKTTGRTGGDIPLTKAQQLKETAQDASSGAYRAMERGGQKQLSADDLLDTAVARGMKQGIERKVPGVGAQNARTQTLIGGKNALEDAVEREAGNNMIGGGRDWAALLAGLTGTGAGGPVTGALAAGGMRALATPSTGSRIAIGMNEASKLGLDDAMQRALMVLMSQGSHPQ